MSTTAAVIGCGDVSSVHFEAIAKLDGATLVGVCDPDPQRLASAMAAYGVPGFADHLSLHRSASPGRGAHLHPA